MIFAGSQPLMFDGDTEMGDNELDLYREWLLHAYRMQTLD
jgi:hypothetical protein